MSDLVAREVSVEPCTRAVTGVRRAEVDAMEAISLNLEMRHVTQNLGYQPTFWDSRFSVCSCIEKSNHDFRSLKISPRMLGPKEVQQRKQ